MKRSGWSLYFGGGALFSLPFVSVVKLYTPPQYNLSDIRIFFKLPTIDDNYWLTDETRAVTDYIKSNSGRDDYVFVFVNDAAYYYLLQRQNPTRFYSSWFAEPNFYQNEMLADLMLHKPKFIIYNNAAATNHVDGIDNTIRLSGIDEWIKEHYSIDQEIGNTKILKEQIL